MTESGASMLETHEEKKLQDESEFFERAGSAIAVWGMGTILVALQTFASDQQRALAVLLGPAVIIGYIISICSRDDRKREDASHIALISLAGCLCAAPITSNSWFFIPLAGLILMINLPNRSRKLDLAPAGPAVLFAAILSPRETEAFSTFFFISIVIVYSLIAGMRERLVAKSIFPFFAAAFLLFRLNNVLGVIVAAFSLLLVFLSYYLRRVRNRKKFEAGERRFLLDDLVVFLGLALLLKSITDFEPHSRYLMIGAYFLLVTLFHGFGVGPAIMGRIRRMRNKDVVPIEPRADSALLRNSGLVASAIAVLLSVRAWPIGFEESLGRSVKSALFVLAGSLLFHLGKKFGSPLQKDAAKYICLYATFWLWYNLGLNPLEDSSSFAVFVFALVQYSGIAATVYLASMDLGNFHEGLWVGIFSKKALLGLRQSRAKTFEVISKAPVVGWMIALSDKAADNLKNAFGPSRAWSASHYSISASILIGLVSTNMLSSEIILNRLPAHGWDLFGKDDFTGSPQFRMTASWLAATTFYCGMVFLAGTLLEKRFLRLLALISCIFINASIWFFTLAVKTNPTSLLLILTSFCCSMSIFRIVYRKNFVNPAIDPHRPPAFEPPGSAS